MKKCKDFFGKVEEIDEIVIKMVSGSPVIAHLPLHNEEGKVIEDGLIEIHQRSSTCLKLRPHEPRQYIVCWNSGMSRTDISFHRQMGEAHGALHAVCRMFERYTRK